MIEKADLIYKGCIFSKAETISYPCLKIFLRLYLKLKPHVYLMCSINFTMYFSKTMEKQELWEFLGMPTVLRNIKYIQKTVWNMYK